MQTVDSLTLAAVARELNDRLSGARVEKIHVPTPTEMIWQLRGGREVFRLLFSVRGAFSRVHLTESRPDNPAQPPMFCMLLRKHLEGSRVLRVEQVGLERALQVVTTGRDELGDPIERVLVAELTGKHSNLILLDRPDGTVLGSLRTVTASMSRERQIFAGIPYDPPPIPPERRDPRDVSGQDLLAMLATHGGSLDSAILKGVHSLGKVAIAQLAADAGISPKAEAQDLESETLARLAATWDTAMANVRAGVFHAERTHGTPWDYRVLWTRPEAPPPSDANALLERYYAGIERGERLDALRLVLAKEVKERLAKLNTRQERIHEGVLAGDRAEEQKQWGELILAYGYGLPPQSKVLEAPNHYVEGSPLIRIPLDERLSPTENAQRYFRRYQKAKAGVEVSLRLIAEGQEEIRYWESVATMIAQATRIEDLVEVRQELNPEPAGKGRPPRGTKPKESLPSRFVSSDGLEILVGRNNRQNDMLTTKLARPDDWWFHTQIIPGSHVLVRGVTGDLPEATRDEAAMLAAWFSQARASSKVPVVFTRKRFVKKPSGAKPGMVIYEQEKTLYVTPDAAAIARLSAEPS